MNPLDILARGVFNMLGLSPSQVREQQTLESSRKANKTKIKAGGQTNLLNSKGNARDFRNPNVSANRPPTTSPLNVRGAQATPPRPPAGGFGGSRGQLSIFGNNPGARVPNTQFRAPSLPTPPAGMSGLSRLLKIAGPAGLLMQGAATGNDLVQSLSRGEGFARIPSLIQKMSGGEEPGTNYVMGDRQGPPTPEQPAPPAPVLPPPPSNRSSIQTPNNGNSSNRSSSNSNSGSSSSSSTRSNSSVSQPRNSGAGNGAPGAQPTKKKFGVKAGKNKKGRTSRLESALADARKKKYQPKK